MSRFYASENAVQICDETTGHAVKSIAYCDSAERAAQLAHFGNGHDDLLVALQELLREVEASGNGTATDFGWPRALKSARAATLAATGGKQ